MFRALSLFLFSCYSNGIFRLDLSVGTTSQREMDAINVFNRYHSIVNTHTHKMSLRACFVRIASVLMGKNMPKCK